MRLLQVAIVALCLLVDPAQAAKWADLEVTVIYSGKAPKPPFLDSSKEPFCAGLKIPDERMIVGDKGQLANFALIMNRRRSSIEAIHPDFVNPPTQPVVIRTKGCQIIPHVAFVRAGQSVKVINDCECAHYLKVDPFSSLPSGVLVPISEKQQTFHFQNAERSNFTELNCAIHPWMKGYLIVRDQPYVGISGVDGVVRIPKLPVGKVVFKLAHENMNRTIEQGRLNGRLERWERGYWEVELKPGLNQYTLKLAPDQFNDVTPKPNRESDEPKVGK